MTSINRGRRKAINHPADYRDAGEHKTGEQGVPTRFPIQPFHHPAHEHQAGKTEPAEHIEPGSKPRNHRAFPPMPRIVERAGSGRPVARLESA